MGCGASAQPSDKYKEEDERREKKRQEDEKKQAELSRTGAEAIRKEQNKVSDRMKEGLDEVKKNAAGYLEDPEMMTKILDVVLQFQQSTIQDRSSVQVLKYSLLGHSMTRSVSNSFSKAVQALTTPQRLAKIQEIDENMFDFSQLQRKIQEVVASMDQKEEGDSDDDDDGDEMNPKSNKGRKLIEYEAQRTEMVDFLSLCYDLITSLPDKVLSKAFKGLDKDQRDEEKTRMAGKVGSAAFAAKVYDFLRPGKDLRRVAFVGPESVGKSTCINHLLADGRNEDFMAVSSGMGTQICCLISAAPSENLMLMTNKGKEHLQSGSGLARKMGEQNEKMKKKKKIGDISAFRATKNFSPPYDFDVELVDVPGIKQETRFESVLALSICSTICICLGKIEVATGQFKTGALQILAEILRELPSPQILCLVTRDVDPKSFNPQAYRNLLQEVIPNTKKIQVVYANFKQMPDDARKLQAVGSFYKAVQQHAVREFLPHKVFTSLSGELSDFLTKITSGMNECEDEYLTDDFTREKDRFKAKIDQLKLDKKLVTKEITKVKITSRFKVTPKTFPVFCIGIAEHSVSEVADEVLIAQELLFECRIAIINWLRDQGEGLHALAFGNNFEAMCEMAYPSDGDKEVKKRSRIIVCDSFCDTSHMEDGDEEKKATKEDMDKKRAMLKWWKANYTHRVGPFLKYQAFPWIIIGYYLIRSDTKCKRLLFDHFLKDTGDDEKKREDWSVEDSKVMVEQLKMLPQKFTGWASTCQEKLKAGKSLEEVYKEILISIRTACDEFERIVNEKKLAHGGQPLDQLFEIAFVMLQRLLVQKPWDGDLKWTPFALHLKQSVKSINNLKQLSKKLRDEKDVKEVKAMCAEALDLMRLAGADKIQKWKKKTKMMEEEMDQVASHTAQLSTGFKEGKTCLTIIQPRTYGEMSEAPDLMTEETTNTSSDLSATGWQIMKDDDYIPCSPELSKLLDRWKENQDDYGYFKTNRQQIPSELSKEQADDEVNTKNNKYVYRVDMKQYLQENMRSGKPRQLKPPGGPSLTAMGDQSGEVGVSSSGMPEECMKAIKKVMSTNTCNNPSTTCPDDMAYAKSAIQAIREGGSRVVIYFRSMNEYSTDPVGIDKHILSELKGEPHVGKCIVVWPSPPSHIDSWASKYWQQEAGDVQISLKLPSDLGSLSDDVEAEIENSVDIVEKRIEGKSDEVFNKAKSFGTQIAEFVEDRVGHANDSAAYFQKRFTSDQGDGFRKLADEKIEEVRQERINSPEQFDINFNLPDGEALSQMPEFLVKAVDVVDGQAPFTLNELLCRSVLCSILLGQTLEHSQKVARQMYDDAFMKVLNAVAEWFCMDGEILLKELAIYCEGGKGGAEADPDVKVIAEFINRDHFVQMFAGCTLWNVMPMLYAVVFPCLWDKDGKDPANKGKEGLITTEKYLAHTRRAIDLLSMKPATSGTDEPAVLEG